VGWSVDESDYMDDHLGGDALPTERNGGRWKTIRRPPLREPNRQPPSRMAPLRQVREDRRLLAGGELPEAYDGVGWRSATRDREGLDALPSSGVPPLPNVDRAMRGGSRIALVEARGRRVGALPPEAPLALMSEARLQEEALERAMRLLARPGRALRRGHHREVARWRRRWGGRRGEVNKV
jgi:hypothetical protein